MKKLLLSSILLILSFGINAQNNENIAIGKKEVFYSKVLNESRKIWIYTPDITAQEVNPTKRYPVLYLLDGNAHGRNSAYLLYF